MHFPSFSPRIRAVVIASLAGALVGVGAFTFNYGQGLSYFSTDPKACVNCHIMRPQYDAWQKASHHATAGCVDCHLPHAGLAKWIAKADNGFRHSKGFTFIDFPEPILIKDGNARTLQDNCLRCHEDLVHQIVRGSSSDADALRCVHCHRDVGHGESTGLGGPRVAAEYQETDHE